MIIIPKYSNSKWHYLLEYEFITGEKFRFLLGTVFNISCWAKRGNILDLECIICGHRQFHENVSLSGGVLICC